MARQLNDDVSLLWLLKGSKQRRFTPLQKQAEPAYTGLAKTKDLKETAKDLSEAIAEQGEITEESIGAFELKMENNYLAKADFDPTLAEEFGLTWDAEAGQYYDAMHAEHYATIMAKIQADAESITESFISTDNLSVALTENDEFSALKNTVIEFSETTVGIIRRGFIIFNGERYFGIVIATKDVFVVNGQTWDDSGKTYFEISSTVNESFGLYTANGWQFWKEGKLLGWFDAEGGLHATQAYLDSGAQLGKWKLINADTTFGIKFIG